MNTPLRIISVTLISAALLASPIEVSAYYASTPNSPSAGVTPTPVGPAEARRAALQDLVGSALDEIQNRYPDDFSFSTGGEAPSIGFKADPPAAVGDLLAKLPVRVQVRARTGFSQQEIERSKVELDNALVSLMGPDGLFISSDESGLITAVVPASVASISQAGLKRSPVKIEEITSRVAQIVRPPSGISLRIIDGVSRSSTTSQWSATGGTRLTLYQYGANLCTSAFVVKYVNALDLGPLTAGHCIGDPLYHSGVIPLNLRERIEDSRGDVAFYRSPVMMAGIIQYNYNAFRSIYSSRNPQQGDWVCRFGVTTGQACGWIWQMGVCSGSVCGLGWSSFNSTLGGDSGGPWFYGNTAMGIHRGWLNSWSSRAPFWNNGEVFTPIGTALSLTHTAICLDLSPDPRCY